MASPTYKQGNTRTDASGKVTKLPDRVSTSTGSKRYGANEAEQDLYAAGQAPGQPTVTPETPITPAPLTAAPITPTPVTPTPLDANQNPKTPATPLPPQGTPGSQAPQIAGVDQSSQVADAISASQAALARAQASGPAPTSAGAASAAIQTYLPPTPAPTVADTMIAEDPFFADIQKKWQDFMSPENQKTTLVDEYNKALKDSGIQELDAEILNAKNIIEGTEDDIRTEITKAGGFATDSQVLAMTNSRNKSLIKNYSNLVATRDSKAEYLNTMMDLSVKDRAEANSQFDRMMNFGFQAAEYGMKMKENAVASYTRTVAAIGYDGLLQSTQNDPYTIGLVEKTMGLPAGGLQIAAKRSTEERALALQKEQLGLEATRASINASNASTAKSLADLSGNGKKPITSATALQLADSDSAIKMLGNLENTIRNNGSVFGPIAGRVGVLNPFDTKAQDVQSIINSTKQIVGKYLEGGVLRAEDEVKYDKILPKLSDTPQVAAIKLTNVKNLVLTKIRAQQEGLASAGFDTGLAPSDQNVVTGPDGQEYEITN